MLGCISGIVAGVYLLLYLCLGRDRAKEQRRSKTRAVLCGLSARRRYSYAERHRASPTALASLRRRDSAGCALSHYAEAQQLYRTVNAASVQAIARDAPTLTKVMPVGAVGINIAPEHLHSDSFKEGICTGSGDALPRTIFISCWKSLNAICFSSTKRPNCSNGCIPPGLKSL